MRFKITPKAILIPTISLFLICVVVTAALALTNNVTADKIAENEAQGKQESMFSVLPDADHFERAFEDADDMYIGLDKDGNTVGYAISTAAQGYGGQIKVMTGINNYEIVAVDVFYNDDETPGLGKNTSNESFRDQFKGLAIDGDICVSKDSTDGQPIDAVTSATISSRAVVKAVNRACLIYMCYMADLEFDNKIDWTWEEMNDNADQAAVMLSDGSADTVSDLDSYILEENVKEGE